MKILTPQEVQSGKNGEIARDVNRIQTTRQVLSDIQKELATAKANFELVLAENKARWAREEQVALGRLRTLEVEIHEKEIKRDQLLIPIELLKEETHNLYDEAEKALIRATEKEKAADEKLDALENKLDDLAEREEDCAEREAKIKAEEKGIESQKLMVKNLSADLSKKWEEYYKTIEKNG